MYSQTKLGALAPWEVPRPLVDAGNEIPSNVQIRLGPTPTPAPHAKAHFLINFTKGPLQIHTNGIELRSLNQVCKKSAEIKRTYCTKEEACRHNVLLLKERGASAGGQTNAIPTTRLTSPSPFQWSPHPTPSPKFPLSLSLSAPEAQ